MKHLLPTVPESTANQKEEEECQNASRARMPAQPALAWYASMPGMP